MYAWHSNQTSYRPLFVSVCGLMSIFFVLLAIFLLGTSKVSLPGASIELPAMENVSITPVDRYIVTVGKGMELFFDGRKMSLEELRGALGHLLDAGREQPHADAAPWPERFPQPSPAIKQQVVIYADSGISYQELLQVVGIARELGFDAFLATQPPDGLDDAGHLLPPKRKNAALDET